MSAKIDLKVVLLGKAFAGKTSIVERFIHDRFSGDAVPYQNTIGAAFGAKKVEVGNQGVTMGIWDTAGSERYEAMSRIYYRGARAAVVCYDLTDHSSFDRAKFWVNELKQNEEDCKIYLVGTKLDLLDEKTKRQVDYHMTTDYGEEIGADIFETSSKSGHNIKELFVRLAMDYLNNPSPPPELGDDKTDTSARSSGSSNKSKCACVV